MAADTVFVPDTIGYHRAFRTWEGPVGRHITGLVTRGVTLAKISVPGPGKAPRGRSGFNYSTGEMQLKIVPLRRRWGTELEGQVKSLSTKSLMVHNGTRPHRIVAKIPGRQLAFFWHKVGRRVALPYVNHPGAPAIPFLAENLRRMVA